MNMKKIALLAAITSTLVVSGCATTTMQTKGGYPASSSVLEIISQESQEAMRATQKLTKYREQSFATMDYRQRNFEEDKIMLDYIGKPDAVLSSLAIRYGYRFLQVGVRQHLPTINFTQYWTTPAQAVVDIDAQIGDAAQLSLDKNQKIITLIYPAVQQ